MSLNETLLDSEINLKNLYDYDGAYFYIIFTVIFYGIFVIGLSYILNQNSEADYYEHRDDPREETARSMLKHLRSEDSTKREALEKLRDEHYRNKYWKKYFGATDNDTHYNKRHKVLEYEAKKIQEIDRKLKSYSLRNQKGAKQQQRPDLSPSMNSGRLNSTSNHQKTLLLHDANRFDTSYVHNNHSTLNSYNNRRHSSHPFFVNKIWLNDSKSHKPEAPQSKSQINSYTEEFHHSPNILLYVTEPEEISSSEETFERSRFKVEKVKVEEA